MNKRLTLLIFSLTAASAAATGSACQPSIPQEQIAEARAPFTTIDPPSIIDGTADDAGRMPHLISDTETIQSVAYEASSTGAIRIADRNEDGHSGTLLYWTDWNIHLAFDEPHYGLNPTPIDQHPPMSSATFHAPYHSFYEGPDGKNYRWMSFVYHDPPSESEFPSRDSVWVARRLHPYGENPSGSGGGNCGFNSEWECFPISNHPNCDPFQGTSGDDDFGADLPLRAPFTMYGDESPIAINVVWTTQGKAVSGYLEVATGNVTCWSAGVPNTGFGGLAGEPVDSRYIDMVKTPQPLFTSPARGQAFIGKSATLRKTDGSFEDWTTPSPDLTSVDRNFPRAATLPKVPQGFSHEPSQEVAVAASSGVPLPGTSDPCPVSEATYVYSDDFGTTWTENIPPRIEGVAMCHAMPVFSTYACSSEPLVTLFFGNDQNQLLSFTGTRDGSQWEQVPYAIDSVGGRNPSAVIEKSREAEECEESFHVYTVVHYDPVGGDLRVVRGTHF